MLTFFLFLRNDENEHKTRSRSNGTTHCWILSSLSTKQKKMGWPVKTSIAVLFFSIFFPLSHLSTHTQKLFPCFNFGRFASLQARLKNILDIKIEKSWCRRVLVNYTFSMMVQDGRSSIPSIWLASRWNDNIDNDNDDDDSGGQSRCVMRTGDYKLFFSRRKQKLMKYVWLGRP